MPMPPEGEFLQKMGVDPATVDGGSTRVMHINDSKSIIYYTGIKLIQDREALDAALAESGFDAPVKSRWEEDT